MAHEIKCAHGVYSRSTSVVTSALLAIQLALSAGVHAEDNPGKDTGQAGTHPTDVSYSPYADRDYPTRVYFGDTHHHTANSGDAFMGGDRLSPEDAYRFARGEQVVSSTGLPVKLARPLDFLVISDHAEGLGVMYEVYNGNPLFMDDETLQRWNKAMKTGGKAAADAMNEVVSGQAQGTLPKPITDPAISGPVMKSV